MKEKISRLSRGIVEQDAPQLELLHPSIEETIAYGRIHRGDFRINSGNQLAFRGLIYSSDTRVTIQKKYFSGQSALISYEVDAEQIVEGEIIRGAFTLVSNGGEFSIPFRFSIELAPEQPFGEMQTAEQFAVYVREEPEQALRLFEAEAFTRLAFMQDLGCRAVYDGLRMSGGRWNALEEFLVGIGAKEAVTLTMDQRERCYDTGGEGDRITVTRSIWGYLSCAVKADASFIQLEKESLTELDFVGNTCELAYTINSAHLHKGRNYGRILITGIHQTLALPVSVNLGRQTEKTGGSKQEYERHFVKYMQAYLDLQADHYEKNLLLNTMQREWDAMARLREPDVRMRLWEAELAQQWGRRELAARLLNEIQVPVQRGRIQDPDAYCYFLYLQMIQIDSWELKERLLKLLNKYQEDGHATPTMALLQVRVDESWGNRPSECLDRMRDFFEEGLRSPYLFLEACRIYNKIPEILRDLDPFTRQALWFGSKHQYLSREVALKAAELAVREHAYQELLYRILKAFYEKYPLDEILHGICAVLIRGDRREKGYFTWFDRGVKQDIRLTRLYDYYLYTLPEDFTGELPQEILLYYSYNSPADQQFQNLLYHNILTYSSPGGPMYQAYEKGMQKYCVEQVLAGNADDFLAKLYRQMLFPELVDEKMARVLPDILKTYRVDVENPGMQYAVAIYGELTEELPVQIRNGVAYVPMYTKNCSLLFMDAYGNRYAGISYTRRLLINESEELLARCQAIYPEHPMLRLLACNQCLEQGYMGEEKLRLLQSEIGVAGIHPLYQKQLVAGIIRYYSSQEKIDADAILNFVDNPYLSKKDRNHLIEVLISQNYLQEAYKQVQKYGYGRISRRSLLKLCSYLVRNSLYEKDEYLLKLAYYLFRKNQYDNTVLQYLCIHFNGLSRDMLEILRHGVRNKADMGDLPERLLGQMLFTGERESMDEVFQLYIGMGPSDRLLVNAYFVMKCFGYFMENEPVGEDVFTHIRDIVQRELLAGGIPLLCLLALTRYFAGLPELHEEDRILCQEMLNRLVQKGIVFPYFKALGRMVRLPDELYDKTLIEYRGLEGDRVEISYRILPDMQEAPWIHMEMPHIFRGIFVKALLLFEDDILEYEIRVTQNGNREIVDRGTRKGEISPPFTPNCFTALNRLIRGGESPEDKDWQQAMLEYGVQDTLIQKLFYPL